jgi:hypothetical protein
VNPTSRRFEPIARRRGTRGFAAVVTTLAGLVVLAVGFVVLPSSGIGGVLLGWTTILAGVFGIAHLVAVVGLVRARPWSARLVGYLAAIGIGVAGYGLLVTLTGLDPFGATSATPAAAARSQGIGLLVWMTGMWLVAARSALRGFPTAPATPTPGNRPMRAGTFAS